MLSLLSPLSIDNLIVGWMRVNKDVNQSEQWFRQGMSIGATALISFCVTFGTTGTAVLTKVNNFWVAFGFALFAGVGAVGVSVLALWKVSPLLKNIPILSPMKAEEQVLQGGFVYTEPNPKK